MPGLQRAGRSGVQFVNRFKGRDEIHLVDHREGNINSSDWSWW